jgi:hypothetical protein
MFFRVKNILYPARRQRLAGLLGGFHIGPGDIALDCGANVGNVTEVLLKSVQPFMPSNRTRTCFPFCKPDLAGAGRV